MDENEFELEGKNLFAKTIELYSCEGCELSDGYNCAWLRCSRQIPECSSRARKDGNNVIFVEKQQ